MKKLTKNITQQELPFGNGSEIEPSSFETHSEPDGNEIESLKAENEQLKATIRNASAHRQITGELEHVGARSPELLFDAVKGDLQFADDNSVVNAAAIVDRLRRAFPEQFGIDVPPASINAGAGLTAIPRITKEALAKMKPAEIAKLDWEEVKRTLAQG